MRHSHMHNPDVDAPRAGWSVRHSVLGLWYGESGTFVRDHRKAKVFLFEDSAKRAASCLHGAVATTVPRCIGETSKGPLVVWDEVE